MKCKGSPRRCQRREVIPTHRERKQGESQKMNEEGEIRYYEGRKKIE
jgi:hypothetical protein